MPLHLEMVDLLVQSGDQRRVALPTFVPVSVEDPGRSLKEDLLLSLGLTGMDLVPGGQLGQRILLLHRLQGHLALK